MPVGLAVFLQALPRKVWCRPSLEPVLVRQFSVRREVAHPFHRASQRHLKRKGELLKCILFNKIFYLHFFNKNIFFLFTTCNDLRRKKVTYTEGNKVTFLIFYIFEQAATDATKAETTQANE